MEIILFVGLLSGVSLVGLVVGALGAIKSQSQKPKKYSQQITDKRQSDRALRRQSLDFAGLPNFPFSLRIHHKKGKISLSFPQRSAEEQRLSKTVFQVYLTFTQQTKRSFLLQWSGIESLEINLGSRVVIYEAWDHAFFMNTPQGLIQKAFRSFLEAWDVLVHTIRFEAHPLWKINPAVVFDALVTGLYIDDWAPWLQRAKVTTQAVLRAVLYPDKISQTAEEILPFCQGLPAFYLWRLAQGIPWPNPQMERHLWRNIQDQGYRQDLSHLLRLLSAQNQESFGPYWREVELFKPKEHAYYVLWYIGRFPNPENTAFLRSMEKAGLHQGMIEKFFQKKRSQAGYLDLSEEEEGGTLELEESSPRV